MEADLLLFGSDELQPAAVADALRERAAAYREAEPGEVEECTETINRAIIELAARGYPRALIARKLAIDSAYVDSFCSASVNATAIELVASTIPEEDPTNLRAHPETFYSEAEVLARERLMEHVLYGKPYVSLSAIKEINNRALGRPVEHLRVQHEHTLSAMLAEIYDQRRAVENSEPARLPAADGCYPVEGSQDA